MFKDIRSGLMKFFTMEKVIMFVALAILAYMLFAYGNNKDLVMDSMSNYAAMGDVAVEENEVVAPKPVETNNAVSKVANPDDLLPSDANAQWSSLNPSSVDKSKGVMAPDLLQAGHHIGLDSVGQSLRNSNQQLRNDPVIQKQDIGPWNQSTIEGDSMRKSLEVGA
jgi:hypothetical protein